MAVPLTKMRKALAQSLDDVFSEAFTATFFHGWAVYYDYNHKNMTYRVRNVELWDKLHHGRIGVPFAEPGLLWIEKAPDELGAYVAAMRILEGLKVTESYRLIQDGMPVAWADGHSAVAEITHYAAVYAQDGPVIIQKKVNGRWKKWKSE